MLPHWNCHLNDDSQIDFFQHVAGIAHQAAVGLYCAVVTWAWILLENTKFNTTKHWVKTDTRSTWLFERIESPKQSHRSTPPKSWSKLHRFAVFSSREQSNTATISSCLKSGFLLKLHNLHRGTKDELGREALSDTSSLSPAPSDGRQQTRIDTGSLYAAEYKMSQRWVSKTWFFYPGTRVYTYKHIIHSIHLLFVTIFPVILLKSVFFYRSLFSRYKASSTLQLSVHRLKPVGNGSCIGYLRTVATTSDVLTWCEMLSSWDFKRKGCR